MREASLYSCCGMRSWTWTLDQLATVPYRWRLAPVAWEIPDTRLWKCAEGLALERQRCLHPCMVTTWHAWCRGVPCLASFIGEEATVPTSSLLQSRALITP